MSKDYLFNGYSFLVKYPNEGVIVDEISRDGYARARSVHGARSRAGVNDARTSTLTGL